MGWGMITLILDHHTDTKGPRPVWLIYSHALQPPSDRPVVTGYQDQTRRLVVMARHYFLSDYAHSLLPSGYKLTPLGYPSWQLDIFNIKEATAFKLVFH